MYSNFWDHLEIFGIKFYQMTFLELNLMLNISVKSDFIILVKNKNP